MNDGIVDSSATTVNITISPAVPFSEGFNNLNLGPFVSGSESGGDGTDWTATPPAGWVMKMNEDHGPTAGGDDVVEFDGWTFMDINSWYATSGQDRDQFTKGTGVIAVADSDEYDDLADSKFNASLSTPAIYISGAEAGSLSLIYDSTWRQEPQSGKVTVSFDGGEAITLLELTPDSQTAYNETVGLALSNPAGAKEAVITWEFVGHNNWWWAIDNVQVTSSTSNGQNSRTIQKGALQPLTLAEMSNNPFSFSYDTVKSKTYKVECSTDLIRWYEVDLVKGTGNEVKFTDKRRRFIPTTVLPRAG